MKYEIGTFVSYAIGNAYLKWQPGDSIGLNCGTGAGKSTFCEKKLGVHAKNTKKKILYLCNRTRLKEQIEKRIMEYDLTEVVTVMTYQKLQVDIKAGILIGYYDYIVADECHYFTVDAYNNYTDISFKYVKSQKDSVILYLSASADHFFKELVRNKIIKEENYYEIEKDYSCVKNVSFYQKNCLEQILHNILETEENTKAVVFCGVDRMLKMHKIFGDIASYICSNNNAEKDVMKICNQSAYHDNTFEKRILFTTSTLDNGIDMKDKNIKYIFSEILDPDVLIQTIGRKRPISIDDTCSIYLKEFNPNRDVAPLLRDARRKMKPAKLCKKSRAEFEALYDGKDRELFDKDIRSNKLFYFEDGHWYVNSMRFAKAYLDEKYYEKIMHLGYRKAVLSVLGMGLESKVTEDVVLQEKGKMFKELLLQYVGKKLFQEEQLQIKELFEHYGCKPRYKGIETFNGFLEDHYP